MPLQHSVWADQVQFIDHRQFEWHQIRRTRYFCYQRFLYTYPGPIRNLKQHLVVVPVERYGDQRLHDYQMTVTPHPAAARQRTDRYGNNVWDLEVKRVDEAIAFEVITTVERIKNGAVPPTIDKHTANYFLPSTRLTTADERITAVAHDVMAQHRDSYAQAEHISDWVWTAMTYGSGATGVSTTAAQALEIGKGLCQDYAHIMLAICRVAKLRARYVSGHMLGEGGSHAWVEVLLPSKGGDKLEAHGFDPTNHRQPNLGYTTVAVGRDYHDVPPTAGSFSAPYSGHLFFSKRAGLTLVELMNGEIIETIGDRG